MEYCLHLFWDVLKALQYTVAMFAAAGGVLFFYAVSAYHSQHVTSVALFGAVWVVITFLMRQDRS